MIGPGEMGPPETHHHEIEFLRSMLARIGPPRAPRVPPRVLKRRWTVLPVAPCVGHYLQGYGIPVEISEKAPPGTLIFITGESVTFLTGLEYRPPLWTRNMPGVREAERDRRRRVRC